MSISNPDTPYVYIACVLPQDDLPRAHELAHELLTHPTHPHLGHVRAHLPDPARALTQAWALLTRLPTARIALDTGPVHAIIHGTPLSPASERVDALASADTTPGVFASDAFARACNPETLGARWSVSWAPGVQHLVDADTQDLPSDLADRTDRLLASQALVTHAIDELDLGTHPERLISLDERQDLVMSSLLESHTTDPVPCAHILTALARWLHPLWMRPEALEACDALLEDASLPGTLCADLRLLQGRQRRKRGMLDHARASLEAVLTNPDASPHTRAQTHNELGTLGSIGEDLEAARHHHEAALALASDHHLGDVQADTWRSLATLEIVGADRMTPETDAVIFDHLERALSYAQDVSDRQSIMRITGERANILSMQHPGRAREPLLRSLALARALHIPHYISVCLGMLTDLALRQGHFEEARTFLEASQRSLAPDDALGAWFVGVQELLLCLNLRQFERADALAITLQRLSRDLKHPQIGPRNQEIGLLIAAITGRAERFAQLRTQDVGSERWRDICALGDAILAPENPALVEALLVRLQTSVMTGRYHDEWHELHWRCAISEFPELAVHRSVPTLAVAHDAGWFLTPDGERVVVSHRPYVHRLFRAFVEAHRVAAPGIDTFTLFERGWPGESISLSAQKNRVYVGIAHLRKLGLQGWLVSGPAGYALSPELAIVELRAKN